MLQVPRGSGEGVRLDLVSGVAFSPDGTAMAVGALTGELVLVRPRELAADRRAQHEEHDLARVTRFSPDGSTLAAGIIGRASGAHGECCCGTPHPAACSKVSRDTQIQVFDVSFSPDGSRLASASADRTVRLWDLATGEEVGDPLLGHSATSMP